MLMCYTIIRWRLAGGRAERTDGQGGPQQGLRLCVYVCICMYMCIYVYIMTSYYNIVMP